VLKLEINTSKANAQLQLLLLDPRKRRRIMRGAGRKVRKSSRRRLTDQTDLSGNKWQARANGKKTKMLRKLGKHLQVHTTPNKATITFGRPIIGKIARAQQDGISQKMTAKEAVKKDRKTNNGAATKNQAWALRDLDYKIRRTQGKGWKTPTLKWIMNNLTFDHAGAIIGAIRKREKGFVRKKKEWVKPLARRSFLGMQEWERSKLEVYILSEAFRLS